MLKCMAKKRLCGSFLICYHTFGQKRQIVKMPIVVIHLHCVNKKTFIANID